MWSFDYWLFIGTKFMEKLQTQLEYFVKSKITYDQTWQEVQIYLSGHQVSLC